MTDAQLDILVTHIDAVATAVNTSVIHIDALTATLAGLLMALIFAATWKG